MRALIDLLAPPVCDGCGVLAPAPWCERCDEAAMCAAVASPCRRCAGADVADHPCWDPSVPVAGTVALTTWRDPVAAAVLRAKLEGRREVFAALGGRLAGLVLAIPDVVVPVPTDPRRVRQRGADHTRELARSLGAALGVPVLRPLRTGTRIADRGSAVGDGRAPLPVGAFVPCHGRPASVAGCHVLVVDDVLTTGGTLAAVARALLELGAVRVDAALVARAGHHPLGVAPVATRAPVAPNRAEK